MPPASLDSSSTKSKPASKGTAAAAQEAAKRAFTKPSSLPLNEDTLAHAKALEGRERLKGAFEIALDRIRPDPKQPRKAFDTKTQVELTMSIERHGILQPITVQYLADDDRYQIITGERRFQAAKSLEMATIPCWVRTPNAQDVLIHQVVENWQRVDLHPFDLADTLATIRDSLGCNQKQIADLTGKPESEISKILSLLKLRPSIQQQHRRDLSGDITRRHLQAIAKLPEAEQEAAYTSIVEQNLTAQDTEKLVQKNIARGDSAKRQGAPVGIKRRFVTAKAIVTISFRKRKVARADFLAVWDEVHRQLQDSTDT